MIVWFLNSLSVLTTIVICCFSPILDHVPSMHRHVRESPDFTGDITPLVLASHLNNYELIDMLLKRGHKLERPHPPNCMLSKLHHNSFHPVNDYVDTDTIFMA